MIFCVFLVLFVIYFSCETNWIVVTYSVLGNNTFVIYFSCETNRIVVTYSVFGNNTFGYVSGFCGIHMVNDCR